MGEKNVIVGSFSPKLGPHEREMCARPAGWAIVQCWTAALLFWVAFHTGCVLIMQYLTPPHPTSIPPIPHRVKIKVEELAQLNKFPSKWNTNMPSSYYYYNDLPPCVSQFYHENHIKQMQNRDRGGFSTFFTPDWATWDHFLRKYFSLSLSCLCWTDKVVFHGSPPSRYNQVRASISNNLHNLRSTYRCSPVQDKEKTT